MAAYTIDKLRNIVLLGHGGDGKTSLAESMLYLTKATDRLGKISDGNTVCDFDPEEIKRSISVSTALAPVEYNGVKINVIDCPGYFDFVGEVLEGVRVADAGIICVTAKGGINVGFEKSWRLLAKNKLPRFIYISKCDEEHADFTKVFDSLREKFGVSVCPITFPVMNGTKIDCIVNTVTKKAYKTDGLKTTEVPVPTSAEEAVEEYRSMLAENAAETDEALMEKFFGGEEFTDEEFFKGIHDAVKSGSICPVFAGSAVTGAGTEALLSGIVDYAPNPAEGIVDQTEDGDEYKLDAAGSPCLFVWKTVADQYGRLSYFKVMSGKITGDLTLKNNRSGVPEKLGHIYMIRGKKNIEVDAIGTGDIGAVAKLQDTKTADTLSTSGEVAIKGIEFPRTCYQRCIAAKSKGGEDKIATGLARLKDEDPCITTELNAETHQQLISGMGDIHIDVICSKLKSKFGVEVDTSEPKIAYREKIRKKVQAEGRHKKQSGGHGQFGHVKMEFEPLEGADYEFAEKVFGGAVPKNFFPAVDKGIRESMERGVLAGYPVVGLKATLYDGSYHEVDSNELSFRKAARLAFKAGLPTANPVILEPYGNLKVYVPTEYTGDIMGDLPKRRGRMLGMTQGEDGMQVLEAEVPMSEMNTYAIDLRSMTRGWGSFTLDFVGYEETPANIQQEIIEEAKKNMVEEEED